MKDFLRHMDEGEEQENLKRSLEKINDILDKCSTRCRKIQNLDQILYLEKIMTDIPIPVRI